MTPITSDRPARAFSLLRSGRRIDLLNPRADCWTDEDLAHNLLRAHRPMGRVNRRPKLTPYRRPKLTPPVKGSDGSARPGGAGRGCAAGASAVR